VVRLFSVKPYHVDPSVWGFAVIVLSIVIDVGRSRALKKTANKYQSQALEADALHFSTDVWSSGVVLVGLFFVLLSKKLGVPWLVKADALAALAVAGIVIWVSFELGMKTVRDLLDAVPAGTVDKVRTLALAVPGVEAVGRTRVRKTGGEWFADVTIQVNPELHTDQAHELADAVEQALREFLPGSDVVVHVEPLMRSQVSSPS
jgi:cation diffusion facilitator family transporter